MNSIKISAVIITYNEESNIGRCIDSLLNVVDEIVVLDSHSQDKTKEICEQRGVKFFSQKWEGYSASKNYANSLTTGDYILSIDADEALDSDLQSSILSIKEKTDRFDAYELNRLTNYLGRWIRHSGWYPEWKIRLFKKDQASWQGLIHEHLEFKGSTRIEKLNGHLLHYSYPTIDSHLKKIIIYSNLAVERDMKLKKRYTLILHALLKPWAMFVRKFFIQLGCLDGYPGFVLAVMSSFERFLRYIKYREKKLSDRNVS